MNSSDAMVVLIEAFTLDCVMMDVQGNLINRFTGDFGFAASELDDGTLRLSAQLSGFALDNPDLPRRLLEANLSGVETGAGAIAPDPIGNGLYAVVETIDLVGLDADAFRLRVVDFMLFVEYWRSEGVDSVLDAIRQDQAAVGQDLETVMLRA